jgi:L-cysteine desulfidase
MNLLLAKKGMVLPLYAHELSLMREKGYIAEDLFYQAKSCVAGAVDARMAGLEIPTMTSGGSGNQGIVTILTPYIVGTKLNIDNQKILESIAIAHIVNAYTKCFLGELSVICGCAVSAGMAAAVAIVYQQSGINMSQMTLAMHNVIGDLSGLVCDGAKPGCALKATSSVDCALRGGFMALENYGIGIHDGVIGKTIEESIQNLRLLSLQGMGLVDPTLLKIFNSK